MSQGIHKNFYLKKKAFKKINIRAGKMTQWLRAHTAFAEDPISVPSTH